MLADVFPELLPGDMRIESATVWESSRFSVDQEAAAERSDN
jgi:N-acyl-L-homoserine lactone synthetase